MTKPRSKTKRSRESPRTSPDKATAQSQSGAAIVKALWPALVLIAAAAVIYANSLWGVFLFDDAYAIVDNPRIRQLFPVERWLATERPVVELSLAINYAIGKLDVVGYHIFNLVVHLAAGLTLFGFVLRTFSYCQSRGRKPTDTTLVTGLAPGALFAFAVALIWLVHPLQTESVTYVIQRAESLMGIFSLLTMYLFVRGVQSAHSWRWYLAAVAACALGMASKAVMVTAPLMVLLYDRIFIAGSFRAAWQRRGWLYLGLGATWGVLVACGIVQHVFTPATERTAIGFGFKGISPWEYALTQSQVILHYLRLSLWPHPLCLDYAWPVAHGVGDVVLPGVVIVGLLLLTTWAFIRKHWIGFAGAWFFVILAPTSSVVPVRDVAFEHRMYLPLAAVIVLIFAGVGAVWKIITRRILPDHALHRWIETAAVVAAVTLLGSCTVRRNRDYHDDLGMWKKVAAERPNNARAHVNVGVLLEQRGQADEAIKEYQTALRLDPDYADAHYNLGVALVRLDRFDEAEKEFREAVRLSPDDAPAHVNLANLLYRRGDWDGSLAAYHEALRITPHDQGARLRLAKILVKKGRFDDAIAEYTKLLEIAPNSAVVHLDFANALIRKGDFPPAIFEFREAARLDPKDLVSRINLGTALTVEGRIDEAITWFHEALRIDPDQPDAHFNLAETLLDQGKLEEAIAEYRLVLRVRPSDAGVYVAIGKALLKSDRLDDAIEQFRQALVIDQQHPEAKRALEYALSMKNK